jgi:DNA-binding NarL/FixJ family response regulator
VTKRVLIVDDHRLVATGLQLALQARGWHVEATHGPTVQAVLELAAAFQPDCVLLDLQLGELGTGIDLIPSLSQLAESVVMLTGETDRFVLACGIEAGAIGWISKDHRLDDLIATVEDVLTGHSLLGCSSRQAILEELRLHRSAQERVLSPLGRLTPRELDVLGALVDGLSCDEIATSQFVSVPTVRSQIRSILQKLGVRSQIAAVAVANRAGWKTRSEARVVEQVGRRHDELQLT